MFSLLYYEQGMLQVANFVILLDFLFDIGVNCVCKVDLVSLGMELLLYLCGLGQVGEGGKKRWATARKSHVWNASTEHILTCLGNLWILFQDTMLQAVMEIFQRY